MNFFVVRLENIQVAGSIVIDPTSTFDRYIFYMFIELRISRSTKQAKDYSQQYLLWVHGQSPGERIE
jgi:hypothetical protein